MDAVGHQHPLVLSQNEGFIIRAPTAYGTTEVARYSINIEWAEVAAY